MKWCFSVSCGGTIAYWSACLRYNCPGIIAPRVCNNLNTKINPFFFSALSLLVSFSIVNWLLLFTASSLSSLLSTFCCWKLFVLIMYCGMFEGVLNPLFDPLSIYLFGRRLMWTCLFPISTQSIRSSTSSAPAALLLFIAATPQTRGSSWKKASQTCNYPITLTAILTARRELRLMVVLTPLHPPLPSSLPPTLPNPASPQLHPTSPCLLNRLWRTRSPRGTWGSQPSSSLFQRPVSRDTLLMGEGDGGGGGHLWCLGCWND